MTKKIYPDPSDQELADLRILLGSDASGLSEGQLRQLHREMQEMADLLLHIYRESPDSIQSEDQPFTPQ